MLLHLVLSQQLKKRSKHLNAEAYVLVDETGKVFASIGEMEATSFTGKSMAFNFPDGDVTTSVDFSKLQAWIQKRKIGNIETVFETLKSAQSLTIQLVGNALKLEREDAKLFIDMLVANGAYTKYYSYWRRTPAFSDWLMNRKEK